MLERSRLETLKQLTRGIAAQFGKNCEVVVHEISEKSAYSSIIAIENGHITGRKVGDGPSHVVLEQLQKATEDTPDHLCYLTRTPDGKVLKSSSMYIRDESGRICAIFCINFDITAMTMAEQGLRELLQVEENARGEPERIPPNVADLLDDLIRQADELVGKPAAMMTKEDKIRAIQFLNERGAMLITKSGDKISRHYAISKYTLYSYLDKSGGNQA